MFANRFTALADACVLASVLKRNLLLSLAEAEFFRVRWSEKILDETERAIAEMYVKRQAADAQERAARSRSAMERAFKDAIVTDYENIVRLEEMADPGDAHVIEAAVKTQATVIVTDNIRHFPAAILTPLNLEARTADAFISDTIDLDQGRAVAVLRLMRERFKKPDKTAERLLLDMEVDGLTQTVDILRPHLLSL